MMKTCRVSSNKMTRMVRAVTFFLSAAYLTSIQSKCTNETHGIYCTGMMEENKPIIFNLSQGIITKNVKSVFLRNSSGEINDSSFIVLADADSLDIQFSGISNFSIESVPLKSLYLIKNYHFPNLTKDLLKRCCEKLTVLFVDDNQGLFFENEAFEYSNKLEHLTITGQKITNLTKNFLQGLGELSYLDLQGNGIECIEGSAFVDLDKLSHLLLNDNDITHFEEKTFTSLKNLENLDLLGLNLERFNSTTFSNQLELKYIGVPGKWVEEKLHLQQLTETFKKLETIGLIFEDNNTLFDDFINTCKYSGFEVRIRKTDDS